MPDSSSSQPAKPYPNPPREVDDADAWGRWAIEFLDRLCREWNKWQNTWHHREEPVYSQSDPDAFLALERTPRRVGTSRKLVTGSPPPGISNAVPLLEVCSDAVNRFSAQSEWRFADQEQADDVADALLQGAQLIQNRRYDQLSHAMLEKLSRLVRMSTRRPRPTERSQKADTPPQPMGQAQNLSTGSAKPNAVGYVARPTDSSSYVPMAAILAKYCDEIAPTTSKEITRVLEDFSTNHVRWTRPMSKRTGTPHPQRRSVHLADWENFVDRQKRQGPGATDDDFPTQTPAEIEARKSQVRRKRSPGK